MSHFIRNHSTSKENFIHVYSGASENEILSEVDQLLRQQGYFLKNREAGNGTYEKGNRVLRILFGAFIKYFKLTLRSAVEDEEVKVEIMKTTSGMSGGLIGMAQVKKELKHLEEIMKTI